tara:strand:+ start:805 stop:1266 length:462 start_codon:yes stop_codon:yes gene_type:complete
MFIGKFDFNEMMANNMGNMLTGGSSNPMNPVNQVFGAPMTNSQIFQQQAQQNALQMSDLGTGNPTIDFNALGSNNMMSGLQNQLTSNFLQNLFNRNNQAQNNLAAIPQLQTNETLLAQQMAMPQNNIYNSGLLGQGQPLALNPRVRTGLLGGV